MNCASIQEDLSAYQDGELSLQQSREINVHLAGCSMCRNQLVRSREVWDALGTLPEIEPSADFRARFWQKVRDEEIQTPSRGWFPWTRWLPTAAAAMALWSFGILGGLKLFNRQADAPSATAQAIHIFTSTVPPSSVEEVFLIGPDQSHSHRGPV